ncbi:hypothetical protein DMN91_004644 [Ooceraea biroi]|uniref:CCHC-type domain-containing protein n=2 Tax=Ooceraea biroi TaxID=2015173 RepID=A0A3L8DPZ7_OOCBI|nr:uncharacterized protein LOC105284029 [Ooceraea biroi]RLU22366.1 hypothetical protein DMN91_004644 [Ooceraea biroi]
MKAADYLDDLLGKLDPNLSITGPSSHSSFHDANSSVSVKLPRIALPKFSGEFIEWETFRGMFESLVDSQRSLSNTEKLHYLKASVLGRAALLINNIQISDANYEAAWQRLCDEFDNRSALIQAHISAFVDMLAMKQETVKELQALRDSVAAALAALTNLGRPVEHWDDLIVFLVSKKFSSKTRREWNLSRGKSREYPTYKELDELMSVRIRRLSDYGIPRDPASPRVRDKRSSSSVHNVTVVKCADCSGDHRLSGCSEFMGKSVDQRSSFVKTKKLYFNCLNSGHSIKTCPSKNRCKHCKRQHHSLLHGRTVA